MSRFTRTLFGRRARSARTTPVRPNRARLGVENLGDRVMPSATTSLVGGTLAITGDSANDYVSVDYARRYHGTEDRSLIGVTTAGGGQASRTQWFSASQVRRVQFDGGDGSDDFYNNTALPGRYDGGIGNDLIGGGAGDDVFVGGPGNDSYYGRAGTDVLVRNGFRQTFRDAGPGDLTVGLVNGSLTRPS
jgi:Ca2+-binding RTX toxin-like protein